MTQATVASRAGDLGAPHCARSSRTRAGHEQQQRDNAGLAQQRQIQVVGAQRPAVISDGGAVYGCQRPKAVTEDGLLHGLLETQFPEQRSLHRQGSADEAVIDVVAGQTAQLPRHAAV